MLEGGGGDSYANDALLFLRTMMMHICTYKVIRYQTTLNFHKRKAGVRNFLYLFLYMYIYLCILEIIHFSHYRNENGSYSNGKIYNWSFFSLSLSDASYSWHAYLSLVDCYSHIGSYHISLCSVPVMQPAGLVTPFQNMILEFKLNWPHPTGSWIRILWQSRLKSTAISSQVPFPILSSKHSSW